MRYGANQHEQVIRRSETTIWDGIRHSRVVVVDRPIAAVTVTVTGLYSWLFLFSLPQ